MTSEQDIARAEEQGRQAALLGVEFKANPYSVAQGSPTRVLASAWRRGFQWGEIELDDASGDLFRGVAR